MNTWKSIFIAFPRPGTNLAEDQQPLLLFLAGGQGGELLQLQGRGWRGDVQVVLEGLEDGAGWEAGLILPIADDTWGGTVGTTLRSPNPHHTPGAEEEAQKSEGI